MTASIYNLKLHEMQKFGLHQVTRVPGGWIFDRIMTNSISGTANVSSVFVPYSDEFKQPSAES